MWLIFFLRKIEINLLNNFSKSCSFTHKISINYKWFFNIRNLLLCNTWETWLGAVYYNSQTFPTKQIRQFLRTTQKTKYTLKLFPIKVFKTSKNIAKPVLKVFPIQSFKTQIFNKTLSIASIYLLSKDLRDFSNNFIITKNFIKNV